MDHNGKEVLKNRRKDKEKMNRRKQRQREKYKIWNRIKRD
jgi:hypothetical protein